MVRIDIVHMSVASIVIKKSSMRIISYGDATMNVFLTINFYIAINILCRCKK